MASQSSRLNSSQLVFESTVFILNNQKAGENMLKRFLIHTPIEQLSFQKELLKISATFLAVFQILVKFDIN